MTMRVYVGVLCLVLLGAVSSIPVAGAPAEDAVSGGRRAYLEEAGVEPDVGQDAARGQREVKAGAMACPVGFWC